ncbi:DUF418 domain-containing protein [Paenibacillus puerhi]|uniref:DUF418 domain-containing protein n=1 Tax=Paenibacillus puerhi TaxID=2692622 RepID=UPI00135939AF|nr:DUF418 domain-containing protein [Paenibacillus puerhi]
MTELQHGQTRERLNEVDVIRGFAVIGIFLVNVPEMIGNGISFQPVYAAGDSWLRLLYDMFVQTKFYSLFAFLFGLGFYLFMEGAERRGRKPKRLFARRLTVLLALGLAHAVLLWYGDVLYTYALVGFMLLLFYRRKPRTVLVWGILLCSLFALLLALLMGLIHVLGLGDELSRPEFAAVPDMAGRIRFLLGSGIGNVFLMGMDILGLFLLGLYAGKKRWFEAGGHQEGRRIRTVQAAALALSLLLFIPMIRYYMGHSDAYNSQDIYVYIHLTGKTMAVFYVCTWLCLMRSETGTVRFSGLAALGRMALTSYLVQSALTMLLVSLLGSRAAGLPLWTGALYAVLVSVLQVGASLLWLRRYRMGPVEWIWRAAVYGSWPSFRLSPRDGYGNEKGNAV